VVFPQNSNNIIIKFHIRVNDWGWGFPQNEDFSNYFFRCEPAFKIFPVL